MMYGYGMGFWGMIVGLIITLAVVVGLVWLVVWAVRRTSGGYPLDTGSAAAPHSAKELLQLRYARGEITREQYQQMKQDLEE